VEILFLTHRLPYAPNRGDRIRAYHLMREMSRFARVSLFSLVHDDEEAAMAREVPFAAHVTTALVPRLANLTKGALRITTSRPLTHALLDAPNARDVIAAAVQRTAPDLVVAYCSGMARFALERPLAGRPFVLDMVDVDSEKWGDLGRDTAHPRKWIYRREARTLAAFEVRAAERSKAVTVVSERERDALVALSPHATVHVMPNGVDVSAFGPSGPPSDHPIVVFSGVMDYAPNVDAITGFANRVWPMVRETRPDAQLVVVGARPTKPVLALAERDRSITVTGSVDAVQPYLWKAAVSVAPLQVARGIQNKVLEALAAGLPAVVSREVAAGLPIGVEQGCLVADEPDTCARAITSLLALTPEARRAKASSAGVETLSWEKQLAPLEGILKRAAERG
jgi:polysaccharide biosynthesis protein PslH